MPAWLYCISGRLTHSNSKTKTWARSSLLRFRSKAREVADPNRLAVWLWAVLAFLGTGDAWYLEKVQIQSDGLTFNFLAHRWLSTSMADLKTEATLWNTVSICRYRLDVITSDSDDADTSGMFALLIYKAMSANAAYRRCSTVQCC